MDCSHYLQFYTPVAEKLLAFGFVKHGDGWLLERDLPVSNLFVRIQVTPSQFFVRVIDRTFNDDFLPFNVKDGNSPVKSMVTVLLDQILSTCFDNPKRDIIEYCVRTFKTRPEQPWPEFPNYRTFKTAHSQKWYAIIMDIPCTKLGLVGEAVVNVINVKLPPEQIQSLIDGQHYFSAYHMNKKYWLTVLLDQTTDIVQLKSLIKTSYNLVEK
ncbi:MAG: MmcQ/YjbR family DNA-binding protein [Clostridia bacterium]|nr:MmcQ/YjbR family DNA-binding protein [Clostridia bacterium]